MRTMIVHKLSNTQRGALREEVRKMLNAGVTRIVVMKELAQKYGLRRRAIRYYVHEVTGCDPANACFRNKFSKDQRKAVRDEILALLNSSVPGFTVAAQLAQKYNVHPVSIWHYIRQVEARENRAPILSRESTLQSVEAGNEKRRRGRPRKHAGSAQPGAMPVRTIFVDGARADLVLRCGGAERVVASLVYQDEGKLMNALQRSMDALTLSEARPKPQRHEVPSRPAPVADLSSSPESRVLVASTVPPIIKPRSFVSPEVLLADIRDACLSGAIPTNRWNGQCYVLPKVTYLVSPKGFSRLADGGLYTHDPRPEVKVYLDVLERLPCVRKHPGGHILTAITVRPGARPVWVVAFDTNGLFPNQMDLGKIGFWAHSPIRELDEAELRDLREKAVGLGMPRGIHSCA